MLFIQLRKFDLLTSHFKLTKYSTTSFQLLVEKLSGLVNGNVFFIG